jgi:L-histidine Nalpha-methyltransferase
MSSVVQVSIHSSQFPERLQRDLAESLLTRQINHKFHYDSIKQAQKWLAVHEAYSPARTDPNCAITYDSSFNGAVGRIAAQRISLISLGCGGGQKDVQLLRMLREAGKEVFYTPSDVSLALVLTAYQNATELIPAQNCHPVVCDLTTAEDFPELLKEIEPPSLGRLITFFGMIPNFEPGLILPKLADMLAIEDHLLLSANLAPGLDYEVGIQTVLPLYDNALTRDWLMTLLLDLGIERQDGEVRFVIENCPSEAGLKRVMSYFLFHRVRQIRLSGTIFHFAVGDVIRLFFSYRYTPERVQCLLAQHQIAVLDRWITQSGEEGVFLCRKKQATI